MTNQLSDKEFEMAKAKKAKSGGAKAKSKPAKVASGEMLLVASKTKDALKKYDVNIASDALEGINAWVYWLIAQGAARAAANGRKTVRAHDFICM